MFMTDHRRWPSVVARRLCSFQEFVKLTFVREKYYVCTLCGANLYGGGGCPRGWVLPDDGLFFKGVGVYLDQIWTTATQLTTTDYNSRQLIKSGVMIGNVTQAVVVSCG